VTSSLFFLYDPEGKTEDPLIAVLAALGILLGGGAAALLASARPRWAVRIGAGSSLLAGAPGIAGALAALSGQTPVIRLPWQVPYGELSLALDPLAAFFLLLIFLITPLAALYGAGSELSEAPSRLAGPSFFCFHLLTASMVMVVLARNGVLFLVAWEVMALASFLLVTRDSQQPEVRAAGRLYLVATHTATAFLLLMFVELASRTGSMDFEAWHAAGGAAPAGAIFLLALVGFGTKAGLVPFHIWLPEAHPAAPSHVSAVMSGVMIKMGFYGLLRSFEFLGPPPAWWGGTLLALGIASALLGVLFALAQQDVKRLLAYSSVENAGLIAIGMGLWLIGTAWDRPEIAVLGLAAALLHTMNHALFKGLLFLGAGAVAHATGTRRLDRMGGLLGRMPVTGACVAVGAAAIAALPPLNGFTSEFLLYLGSYRGVRVLPEAGALLPLAALIGLALAGGLALACFARLFGVVFLGTPRTGVVEQAHEPHAGMRLPMVALAGLCLAGGFAPRLALLPVERAVMAVTREVPEALDTGLGPAALCGALVAALALLLAVARAWLLRRRQVRRSVTWDCGYDRPTPRMQYTASSFSEPIREIFAVLLPARRRLVAPEGLFPRVASFHSELVRPFQERLYRPAFEALGRGMSRLRWLHHGRVQLYVLYIVVTLIVMVAWFLAFEGSPR
jgi:hydrogenase-4 component B